MKLLLISTLFSFSTLAQQLPQDWFSEGNTQEKSNEEENLTQLSSYLNKVLDVQESVLEKSEEPFNKGLNNWAIDGQKTDLAISKSGLLGLAALKATKAVELSWKKQAIKKENGSEESSNIDAQLSSEMSEKEVLDTVRPAYKILLKNLPAHEYSWRAKNFEDHVLRYHRAVKGITHLNTTRWTPSKFRLDLSASYSSPLFGFTRLSGDTRLRLEWKIIPSSAKNLTGKDQEVVQKILEDVERATAGIKVEEGFKLDNISIGLGLSKKNLLSFSKVKGSIVGHLFLKKSTKKSLAPTNTEVSDKDGHYEWPQEDDSKFLGLFKRSKFRKGIKKSFKMTNWFSRQFKNRDSSWVITQFKTSFTLSYSGFLGLSGTSSSSIVSMTYKKK